jgi:putative hydrolase of the HAD superfamily
MAALPSAPDLSHVETWVFDLDNTLYCASTQLFDRIGERMTAFIAEKYALDLESAAQVREAYYHSHGTTLSGLMAIEGQDPGEFLTHVHDVDLSPLAARADLAAALARLPGRRLVYTNGSKAHAERVMERLGVGALFEAIHDITAADYRPKPYHDAYAAFLDAYDISPERAAMFEDVARNLEVPHAMGMTTVLVLAPTAAASEQSGEPRPPYVHHVARDLAGFLARARVTPPCVPLAPQE